MCIRDSKVTIRWYNLWKLRSVFKWIFMTKKKDLLRFFPPWVRFLQLFRAPLNTAWVCSSFCDWYNVHSSKFFCFDSFYHSLHVCETGAGKTNNQTKNGGDDSFNSSKWGLLSFWLASWHLHLKQLLLMVCVETLAPSAYFSRKLQLTNTVLWGKSCHCLEKNKNKKWQIKPLVKEEEGLLWIWFVESPFNFFLNLAVPMHQRLAVSVQMCFIFLSYLRQEFVQKCSPYLNQNIVENCTDPLNMDTCMP